MVNQTQPSIEHIVLERRLSQISGSQISGNGVNGNGNGDFGPETNDTKFSRSPRSSSIRRRSEMSNPGGPVVVNVPMPQLQVHTAGRLQKWIDHSKFKAHFLDNKFSKI